MGSVPESSVPSDEIRECRSLVRGRVSLRRERMTFANKIHALLLDNGITRQVKPLSQQGREFLEQLSFSEPWNELLASYLTVIETLTDEIDRLDTPIKERAKRLREAQVG